jgi:DNA polymerase elongation subunit (family B)
LDEKPLPKEFNMQCKQNNIDVDEVKNEFALLDVFIQNIQKYDPDIIIGHDLYSDILEIVINRLLKTFSNNW